MPDNSGRFKGISVPEWTDWRSLAAQLYGCLERVEYSRGECPDCGGMLGHATGCRVAPVLRAYLAAEAKARGETPNPEGDH